MASLPVRDPVGDHMLTPQNAALAVIDYQPSQFAGVRSIDRDLLLENIVSTVKSAKAFDLPIVHSTINVATGRGQPTVPGARGAARETTRRSTGRQPTRGKTPTSSPPCAPPDGAS